MRKYLQNQRRWLYANIIVLLGTAIGLASEHWSTWRSHTHIAQVESVILATCKFDSGTTAWDYFQMSSAISGGCHDTGALTCQTSSQVLGRVLSSNIAAGTYHVVVFTGPDASAECGATTITARLKRWMGL